MVKKLKGILKKILYPIYRILYAIYRFIFSMACYKLWNYIHHHNQVCKYNLAIVAIIKNEGDYIEEWIRYHKLVGCEHFYIYNNDSTDNTVEILSPYVKQGLVTLIPCPGRGKQIPAYEDALRRWGGDVNTLLF